MWRANQSLCMRRLPIGRRNFTRRSTKQPVNPIDPEYCEGCSYLTDSGDEFRCKLGYSNKIDGEFSGIITEDMFRPGLCQFTYSKAGGDRE